MTREVLYLTKDEEHIEDCAVFGQALRHAFLNPNRTKVTIIRGDGSVYTNREKKDTIQSKSERV